MGSPEAHKDLIREFVEEIESGNIDVIDDIFAEDFTTGTDVVRSEIESVDRESLKIAWKEFLNAFPDIETERQELIAEDDTVVFIQIWRGTHEGEFRGIEPTGNQVTHEMWGRYIIEDGQIVHGDAQVDNFSRFKQLGLELSIEGYRTLIDTAPDPIIIADVETGHVVETNEAAETLIERPREDIIGSPQHALHPDDQPYEELFADTVARAQTNPVELAGFADGSDVELRRSDGSRVPVEINAQVVQLAEVTTLVSIYRDVSGRRHRKQRLQVLNRILRHNLRNDLGVIEGLANTLAAELDGEHAKLATKIKQTAHDLTDLGQKARQGERIRTAETTVVAPVSLRSVIADVVADYDTAKITVDVPAELTVTTVRQTLLLALQNLVENGIEHNTSDGAGPQVSIDVEETQRGAVVTVEDNGPGIPDHELSVLDDGTETPLEHSSSVGLWLIYWAVEAIRGDISFQVSDSGTRAIVQVPSLDLKTQNVQAKHDDTTVE